MMIACFVCGLSVCLWTTHRSYQREKENPCALRSTD